MNLFAWNRLSNVGVKPVVGLLFRSFAKCASLAVGAFVDAFRMGKGEFFFSCQTRASLGPVRTTATCRFYYSFVCAAAKMLTTPKCSRRNFKNIAVEGASACGGGEERQAKRLGSLNGK